MTTYIVDQIRTTYVTDYMRNSLANHVFEPQLDGCLRMGIPGDCHYEVHFVELANKICIAGDIRLGENGNGIISSTGYKLPWFAGQLTECYLCEKFFPDGRVWQWAVAVEELNTYIKDGGGWYRDHADEFREFIKSPGWEYDVPTEAEFYEFMTDMGDDCCEMLGYDYPRGQAGWLCAIQQKFSELWKEAKCPIKAS